MKEKCYNHRLRDAIRWRHTVIFGEPDRVPLCYDCVVNEKLLHQDMITYPLNDRELYDDI